MTSHMITSSDGTRLFVRDEGPTDAQAIVLIHGWSQHHLCWTKQFESDLTKQFRLIAPDLRGHGASDKPVGTASYDHSRPWADDVAAIINTLELEKPLLVGWSMGGWVVFDYLRLYGDSAISGIATIGSSVVMDAEVAGRRHRDVQAKAMLGDDQAAALEATIKFVKACVAAPLSKKDMAMMVGYNMLVSPETRKASRLRKEDYREVLEGIAVPSMIIHGQAERVCVQSMFETTCEAMPGAIVHEYPGIGHSPFWEAPDRFNTDLAAFADSLKEGDT